VKTNIASIIPLRALKDNYIWVICDPNKQYAAVVDPGDAIPVIKFLESNNIFLTDILLTHHHQDHSAGIPELLAYSNVPVWRSSNTTEGMTILLEKQQITLKVIEIPGHTLDHIAFYNDDLLFCGDTLFSAGCGRVFEGTAAQMLHSLQKLKNLSENIKVYCGHEYTVNNLNFAARVDPENQALQQRLQQAQQLQAQDLPTLPSTMQQELSYNPFLRTNNPVIIDSVSQHCAGELQDEVAVFAELRQWKNNF
jgi:hydroxyacylglutathione hydrolase